MTEQHRIFAVSVASVYPHYLAKAEKKGRSQSEVDAIICWLTGHTQSSLHETLDKGTTFAEFFARAPHLNPARSLITGVICGIRLQDLPPGTMQEIRYLDKLIDELAKGKPLDKILRH